MDLLSIVIMHSDELHLVILLCILSGFALGVLFASSVVNTLQATLQTLLSSSNEGKKPE